MSLTVPTALLDRAKAGPIGDAEFLDCIRDSLPYAWAVVSEVAEQVHRDGGEFADHSEPPPGDKEQGELLRLMASSSMRTAVENHFGVKLEFQNCCKVAAFAPAAIDGEAHKDFVSPRAQLLNQKPELINC
jgi:hypothetical protein